MSESQTIKEETHFSQTEIKDMIARWMGSDRVPKQVRIFSDTSDIFRIDYDDVVILGGRPYLVRNNEHEGRFGIDDQEKFWVKRARDLTDGSVKVIKLTFHERFEANVGELKFECFRSPQKEARILDLVKGKPSFMQGHSVQDSGGNTVRILDFIKGKTLADFILTLGKDHEDYFYNYFPGVMDEYIEIVDAIKFLHDHEEKHGDIRRDHVIKESMTGKCRWIDFDFNYLHKENMFGYDLYGLGNILVYLTGRGDVTLQNLKREGFPVYESLYREDLNIIFNNRLVNLKKVYPYIPESLNLIMLHYSMGAETFYEDTGQLLNDLYEARSHLTVKREET
jgi:hypothetical protein